MNPRDAKISASQHFIEIIIKPIKYCCFYYFLTAKMFSLILEEEQVRYGCRVIVCPCLDESWWGSQYHNFGKTQIFSLFQNTMWWNVFGEISGIFSHFLGGLLSQVTGQLICLILLHRTICSHTVATYPEFVWSPLTLSSGRERETKRKRKKEREDQKKVDGKLLNAHFPHIQLPPLLCGTKEARNRQMTEGRIYH